ncbi:hypothetical protein IFM89_004259 [Coptis chinensis]|uniref:F-box associated beta-propeller type 1 domain-containing protein n=1 Tax=Coptis chinensis TaxID=261450 RepID=A0A835M3P5_9MAGN|nr:hypothetical protein IFM89_004259 [Coptis chinensis]
MYACKTAGVSFDADYFKAYVYTLGTNAWRSIPSPYRMPSTGDVAAAHLNGALHRFKLSDQSRWKDTPQCFDIHSIISFNIRSEEFRQVALNFDYGVRLDCISYALGVLQGCLSVWRVNSIECYTEIWVMKDYGLEDSWTRLHTVRTVFCH